MLSHHFDQHAPSSGPMSVRSLKEVQKVSLETFGSKRAKRMFGLKSKNSFNPELVKDQLEATLAGFFERMEISSVFA